MSLIGSQYKKTVELRRGVSDDFTSDSLIIVANPDTTEDFTLTKEIFQDSLVVSASSVSFDDAILSSGKTNVQDVIDTKTSRVVKNIKSVDDFPAAVSGGNTFGERCRLSYGWLD